MEKLIRDPIDSMKTEVRENGKLKYYEVGSDLNLEIEGTLVPADCSEGTIEPSDVCTKKSKMTKRKCGVSKDGLEVGIKSRENDKQYIITASRLVGFNKEAVTITDEPNTYKKEGWKYITEAVKESYFDYEEKIIDVIDKDPETGKETPGTDIIYVPVPKTKVVNVTKRIPTVKDVTTHKYTYNLDSGVFKQKPISAVKGNKLQYVEFSQDFVNSGIENHCKFSKDLHKEHAFDYYGIIYTVNDIEVMDEIQGDQTTHIVSYLNEFIEFFSEEEFRGQNSDGTYNSTVYDYSNDYSTIGGALGSDTTWTTGTYYLSSNIALGVYSLTLDAVGGDIIIKTSGGAYLQLDNTGDLSTANTSATNKVYFTSKNDDAKGETISGSTGTPAKGDQNQRYCGQVGGTAATINLSYCEFWYSESKYGVITSQTNSNESGYDVTLNNIILKYCGIPSGMIYNVGLIGLRRYIKISGAIDLQNISIDDTNSIKDDTLGYGIYFNKPQTANLKNIYINLDSSYESKMGIAIVDVQTNSTFNFENIYCKANAKSRNVSLYQLAAITITYNIYNCIVNQVNGTGEGLYFDRDGGTVTVNAYNNIFMNCTGSGKYSFSKFGTMIFNEGNNGFYNNGTNTSGFTPTNPILADPQLSDLVGSDIEINDDCPFPDGLAVTNYTDYEKAGSDTFDNLAVDESTQSATGRPYLGTENVTPGINYTLDRFTYYLIGGALGSHTTLTTGTYYVTASLDLGNFNLIFDAVGGPIYYKTSGAVAIRFAGTGNLATANTSAINNVCFTSKNDNTKGETIAGSSGNPVKGDQSSRYIHNDGIDTTVNLDYCEFWYCESTLGVINTSNNVDQIGQDMTLNHITLKYCGIPAGLSYNASLIGLWRYSRSVGDINLQNISIDTTNSIKDNSKGIAIYFNEAQTMSMQNIYIDIDPTSEALRGISIIDIETDSTATFKNIYCRCKVSNTCFNITQDTNHVITWNVYNCIVDNNGSGSYNIYFDRNAGTITANVYDNIFINASAGNGARNAGVPALNFNEGNNGYNNNGTDAIGFTPTDPIAADPALGNIAGAIADGYFLPNGFGVGNLGDYEYQGSDTFDNLSIDETKYSMTGYLYAGGDKVTPGCYYEMTEFGADQYGAGSGLNTCGGLITGI